MNSVFNGKAHKLTPFNNVWISSCPDDSGLSIGAALYLYNNILQKKTRYELKHNFLGPNYSSDKIKKDLIKYKVKFKYEKNITKIVNGPISAQVTFNDYEKMVKQGLLFSKISKNQILKI